MSILKIKADPMTRNVSINGEHLSPVNSLTFRNHSPDGFNWGYWGSGPAQLALAICMTQLDPDDALLCYQDFKQEHVGNWRGPVDLDLDFIAWHQRWLLDQKEQR